MNGTATPTSSPRTDRFFTDTYDSFARSVGEAGEDALSLAPRFAVEARGAPGVVGVVGHYVSHPVLQTVEVWYLIGDPAARGRGYGREAVGLLVDHLFRTTSLERVAATCDVENLASCRLVEGLGFRREGTLRRALHHHARWHERPRVRDHSGGAGVSPSTRVNTRREPAPGRAMGGARRVAPISTVDRT